MGIYNVLVVVLLLQSAYWLHRLVDTPFDWLMLGSICAFGALLLSDKYLKSLFNMARWVWLKKGE